MQADDVALGQKLPERLHRLGIAVAKPVGVVEENHLHAHRLGEHRQLRPDIAVADDAQRAATHFMAVGGGLVPGAVMRRDRARKDPPQQHHDFADHEFGDAARIRERCVEDGNAAPARRVEIDLVGPDAETSDHRQPVGLGKNIRCQLGSRPNAQEIDTFDGLTQRGALKGLGQPLDAQIFRIREQFDGAVIHALQEQDFALLIGLRRINRHIISMDRRVAAPATTPEGIYAMVARMEDDSYTLSALIRGGSEASPSSGRLLLPRPACGER